MNQVEVRTVELAFWYLYLSSRGSDFACTSRQYDAEVGRLMIFLVGEEIGRDDGQVR